MPSCHFIQRQAAQHSSHLPANASCCWQLALTATNGMFLEVLRAKLFRSPATAAFLGWLEIGNVTKTPRKRLQLSDTVQSSDT